jgi:cell shape-determining protein MreC|tara:strand:- start:383 stop:613 length:231 start_codon:yes stop_codon:yes gene_type:complete
MKENKLIEMRNKVETLGGVANQLIREVNNIKQLALGTLETIKQMPDYEEAINKLKEQAAKESSKTEEAKSLETTSD